MPYRILLRRDTLSNWIYNNPVLMSGEPGYETDTGKAKIGNGSTAWNSLSYALTGSAGTVTSVTELMLKVNLLKCLIF